MTKKEMIIEIVDYNYTTPKQFEEDMKKAMRLSKEKVEKVYKEFKKDEEHASFYKYLLTRY